MRLINKLINKEIILEGSGMKVSDIKNKILNEISGIYYKNIIVIKGGEVLEDEGELLEDSEYHFAIIPIKCQKHPTHQ